MADEQRQLECALDLMRRLPPAQLEQNLSFVLELVPHLTEDLLQTVDQPLKVAKCPKTGKEYLLCDYNRDGDSYRSPWSNEYDPPLADGAVPSDRLRNMEIAANEIFNTYRELYYEGGVSSVYFWDLEEGFAACVLIKKDAAGQRGVEKGSWDSIHVIEVTENSATNAHYKLTSTIMLGMKAASGNLDLSGSITRQSEQDCAVNQVNTHIVNMGNMIQDMENKLRNALDQVYFGKTVEITSNLHSIHNLEERRVQERLAAELSDKASLRQK
eukprot:GEZU01035990.1.p1 GENE.GEZU01035990.1~~GEZU01035990.1.p1  ORF type:complete len:271 (-),score=103.11 GEZU01035990.1:439-1251(-)